MRILLLLNSRFPTEKAYGIQTVTMAEGYVADGHEVAIAYPRRTNDVPQPIPGVVFLPFGQKIKLRWPWMFHPLRFIGAYTASQAIRTFKPDITIANDPFQAAVLAKKFPLIWELHDVPTASGFGRSWLVGRIASNVRAIISTNRLKLEKLQTVVQALPPYLIAPNAVTFDPGVYRSIKREAAREKLGIPVGETSMVYAGQLFDWKGVDTLIASAAHLPSSSVIHIVGGGGTDLERCQRIAAALPPDAARVVFHGLRPKEEIPFWLRAATLVIIPNSGRFEISVRDTSPLKLFEALAAGAAIIASDLPSIRDAVGPSDAIHFVTPDDPQALAASIRSLCHNSSMIDALQKQVENVQVQTGRERASTIIGFIIGVMSARGR